MKNPARSLTPALLAALSLATLATTTAVAETLYWDTNGASAGTGTTPNGTWDVGTTTNWTTDANGSSATTTFTTGDTAIFSAGSEATTATIAASGTPNALSITIEDGSVAFSGNYSISTVGSTGVFTVATGASATSSGQLNLLNNTEFAIAGSFTSAQTNGAGKQLTKTGAGTLTLSDSNSSDYALNANAGLIILQRTTTKQLKASTINNGGTVRIAANEQFGNNVTINTGGILELSAGVSDNVANLSGAGSISAGANSTLGVTSGTFTGSISGDLDIIKTTTGTHTFSGTSTSTGDITVSVGTYTLGSAGSLTFTIGANGVNNAILGAGTDTATNFNGTFNFDLTGADLTNGNSWLIVNVANLNESFSGGTFAVAGFTEAADVWTNGTGFSFSELSGVLSYSAVPEPSSYALLAGTVLLGVAALRRRRCA